MASSKKYPATLTPIPVEKLGNWDVDEIEIEEGATNNCQVVCFGFAPCRSISQRINTTNLAKSKIREKFYRAVYMSKHLRDLGGAAGLRHMAKLGWTEHGISESVDGGQMIHLSFIPSISEWRRATKR